jgi:VanZ family protein
MKGQPPPFQVAITRLARAAFTVGVAVVIVLSLMPGNNSLPDTGLDDRIEHFIAYFALAAAGATGFHGRRAAFIVVVSLIGFGILMEIGQMFSPGREPSILDVIANGLGAICGAAAASVAWRLLDALRPLVKAQ